ncbi:MAG: hypothetical protein IJW51_01795 [Clostridia bacterium]|nr:hypothetical protein [Clostridia bacterium]
MKLKELLGECLFPVILGSNTEGHACVRRMEKRYGVGSTVVTGKRALTLRFLPDVKLIFAPPTLADEFLLSVLRDLEDESGFRLPLLIECDTAYHDFVVRNRAELEARFILRHARELLGGS